MKLSGFYKILLSWVVLTNPMLIRAQMEWLPGNSPVARLTNQAILFSELAISKTRVRDQGTGEVRNQDFGAYIGAVGIGYSATHPYKLGDSMRLHIGARINTRLMAGIGGIYGFVQFGPMIGVERRESALLYSYNYYGGYDQAREPIDDDFNIHNLMAISGRWGIEITAGKSPGGSTTTFGINPRYYFSGDEKWKEYYIGIQLQQWKQDGGSKENTYTNRFACLQFVIVL